MTPDQTADLVVKYAAQLAWSTLILGAAIGAILVLGGLWLRAKIAEYRRGQQFKINRVTPYGM